MCVLWVCDMGFLSGSVGSRVLELLLHGDQRGIEVIRLCFINLELVLCLFLW